jgi:hypothetical protein
MATVYQDTSPRYFPQPFQNNSVNAQGYYVTVTDGVTTVFRKGTNASGQEQIVNVGSIAKSGGFTNTGNASREEVQYFTANARKTVNEQAVPVVSRGIGGSAGGGNAQINQVLGTNLSSQSTQPQQSGAISVDALNPALLGEEISDNTNKIRPSYGSPESLRYPLNLNIAKQDCIQFRMFRYAARSLSEISEKTIANTRISGPGASPRSVEAIGGVVTLPIQPSISDSNGVDWGGANLNPIEAYAASMSRAAMDIPGGSVTDALSDILGKVNQNLKSTNTDLQNAFKLYLAQEAVGVQGLLSRTTGAILNPNLELLFNGPTLRPFNFTFRLSPRSKEEANNVKKIIRFFKQGMSVKTSNTSVFLKAPNIFKIRYISPGDSDQPGLNRIKDCALLGCDVNYTPDGTYMTFEDGTMTSYDLTLRFSELEPIYEDDYFDTKLSETEIGY